MYSESGVELQAIDAVANDLVAPEQNGYTR